MADRFLADLAKQDARKERPAAQSAGAAAAKEETAPVFTSDSPAPDGDPVPARVVNRLRREEQLHADGVLTRIDCEGQGWRLHLKSESGEMIFLITGPSDVQIEGADDTGGFTFGCGTEIGKNATVYYVVKADMPSVTGVARKLVLTK
jgi:hypothetical protein